jgi:hypothetical protein
VGRVEERARAGNGASKESDEMAECWRPEGGAIVCRPEITVPCTRSKVSYRGRPDAALVKASFLDYCDMLIWKFQLSPDRESRGVI